MAMSIRKRKHLTKISELEEQIEEAESQVDDLQEEMDKDIPRL